MIPSQRKPLFDVNYSHTEEATEVFCKKRWSLKFRKIRRNSLVTEPVF